MGAMPGFIYGIDVPRFYDSNGDGWGDLAGVRERLDYVEWLGASWIWLLPFYVSPRRDNGYDVVDHRAVDPRLGERHDFTELVRDAHARGIHVMIDLIAHHTSIEHPWFAEQPERYVWAGPPRPQDDEPTIFPGEEQSVWTLDPARGRYYRHLFYAEEPDLNLAHAGVRDDLIAIADHWARLGVDGFRIDAAADVVSGEHPAGFGFIDRLRSRLEAIRPGIRLIGETDVPPKSTPPYFERGRFDALLGFALNNAVFLSLARRDIGPVRRALRQIDRHSDAERWVNFLRNADELDLEQLSSDERAEVFEAFAPTRRERAYGRGIRHALVPMLGTEGTARAFDLLFSLPGIPLVMAGQEIGLGEDLDDGVREAVRLAMQWSDAPNGGFSAATSPFVRPVQADGPLGWPRVNVADARRDPDSLLSRFRQTVAARDRSLAQARSGMRA